MPPLAAPKQPRFGVILSQVQPILADLGRSSFTEHGFKFIVKIETDEKEQNYLVGRKSAIPIAANIDIPNVLLRAIDKLLEKPEPPLSIPMRKRGFLLKLSSSSTNFPPLSFFVFILSFVFGPAPANLS